MIGSEQPGPVRMAGRFMWGLCAVGAVLIIAGVIELNHLNDNLPIVEQKSTFLAEAQRAAARVQDSADLAVRVGTFNLLGALALWPVLARGMRWGRPLILIFVCFVALCQVLLILQDGTVGVQPYVDMSNNLAEEKLINSLLVAPGYFLMLYPAESAGLILAVMIGWRMFQDPTVEYFQQRRRATGDRAWDISEILARRARGAEEQP